MDSNNNIQNQTQQQYYSMPRIGDQAPAFEAVTTQGKIRSSPRISRANGRFSSAIQPTSPPFAPPSS